jgi:chitin disaccharide deacetylase
MTKALIVNADDYGLTEQVSKGILRAHREGIVTSTTVLAVAPAFSSTVSWLQECSQLGVGVHLCLVGEDPPICSPASIPSLVNSAGNFPNSWRTFLPRAAMQLVNPDDIEREFAAQIERVLKAGIRPTHLDSHQHLHLWPSVSTVVLKLAERYQIPAIRISRSEGASLPGLAMNGLAYLLESKASRKKIAFPRNFAGFDHAGSMKTPRLLGSIRRMATLPGSAEIGVHPGEMIDEHRRRYPWGYAWGEELAALLDPTIKQEVQNLGFALSNFAALV